MIILPELIEAARAQALPGREAVSVNEVLRMFLAVLSRRDRPPPPKLVCVTVR
jgi:hypothetical protein